MRILHVEDSHVFARLIAEELKDAFGLKEFAITHADKMCDAVAILASGEQYDVILLDLSLPDAKGYDALNMLRDVNKTSPIIVLSGAGQHEMGLQSVALGAQDYIMKDARNGEIILKSIEFAIERHRSEQAAVACAMTDPLTQLPNRGYFLEYAATAVERAKRSNLRLVLFYIDFDGFKALNDTYGHVEGDNFLTEIGGRFKTILRKSDFCSRLGGDEFAVLVETEHASISACRPFVDGLLAEMRKPFTLTNGNKIKSCCSVGGAIFDPSADEEKSIEDFMNEADEAMYLAKQSGGDCLRYSQADAQPQPGSGNVAQIGGQELRPARRFYVEFVPIYGVSTLSLDGYECVINEHDGVLGANSQLRPGATELVLNKAQQDEWGAVAASVTELLDKLESGGTKVSFVCINLQVEQMSSPRFGERIRRVVDAVRDKLSIIIKFPESGLLEGNAALIRAIKELKALNVPVALAGFGSTQCCLMEVLQIPFDIIEIDKKMADRIMESEAGALGVKAVVRLAQELNKQILVSGIECERTWVELRKLGVDYRVGEQPLINKKSQKI